jgi:hypothetical protein
MLQAFERLSHSHDTIHDTVTLDQDTRKRLGLKSAPTKVKAWAFLCNVAILCWWVKY